MSAQKTSSETSVFELVQYVQHKYAYACGRVIDSVILSGMDSQVFDYIIIGAGAAGLTSAQYGARSGLNTLVLDTSSPGGQALHISCLENYPGLFPAPSGAQYIENMKQQALSFGAQITQAKVLSIDKIGSKFSIETSAGSYSCFAVLIATGAVHRQLGVPGEKELTGSGVSYCATCDGPFFKDRHIVVVGGGDSACDEAVYLATLTHHVTLIHRRNTLRAQKAVADRLLANDHITVRYNETVRRISGSGRVESITTFNSLTNEIQILECDAVFIFAGMNPNTELVSTLPTDKAGYIITNENMETPVPGLFCAGDVRAKPFRQLVTAAADGATAAHQAGIYIHNLLQSITGALS